MRAWHLFLVLFAIGLATVGAWRLAANWRPAAEAYPVQGVSVSARHGAIDWHAVAADGADFAYAVATIGADRRDPLFEANWTGMAEAGLRRGAIHVYSLCRLASDQADAFNTFVVGDPSALPAAVSVDYDADCAARPDRAVLIGELRRFAMMVETHMGKPILFRLSRAVERDYAISAGIPRPLWAMGNVFPPDYGARPWRMWQASDFRRVAGIAAPAEWNVVRP